MEASVPARLFLTACSVLTLALGAADTEKSQNQPSPEKPSLGGEVRGQHLITAKG